MNPSIAAIFDMDGVLIRSEENQSEAFAQVLRNNGKEPKENKLGLIHDPGVREEENWEKLRKKYGLKQSVAELKEARQPIYMDLLKKNPEAMPGAIELLKGLSKLMDVAVTSSAPRPQVEAVLKILKIEDDVTLFVSGDDVDQGKPDPQCYLITAEKLEVDPLHCAVFEDSPAGAEAGHRAGMYVVAVPTKFTEDQDFGPADMITNSLEDIEALTIEEILEEREEVKD